MKLTDFVNKENKCYFLYYRQGTAFYKVANEIIFYKFPVPLEDIGDATLNHEEKSVFMMRYIRKALADKTLVPL